MNDTTEEAGDEFADSRTDSDGRYRTAAKDAYGDPGLIEIDADAKVSHGDGGGAYVAAWLWVDTPDD